MTEIAQTPDTAAMRVKHRQLSPEYCHECGQRSMPCDAIKLCDEVDRLRDERDEWKRLSAGWEQVHNELRVRTGGPVLAILDRMQRAEQALSTAAADALTAAADEWESMPVQERLDLARFRLRPGSNVVCSWLRARAALARGGQPTPTDLQLPVGVEVRGGQPEPAVRCGDECSPIHVCEDFG